MKFAHSTDYFLKNRVPNKGSFFVFFLNDTCVLVLSNYRKSTRSLNSEITLGHFISHLITTTTI